MRRRRREMLEAAQKDAPETIVIADSERDGLLEQLGAAMDAIRLAGIARSVFPDVSENHDTWEVARAILADEKKMREIVIEGVRAHGAADGPVYAVCLDKTVKQIAKSPVPWKDRAKEVWDACAAVADKDDVADLYRVLAVDDARVNKVLGMKPAEAKEYLGDIRRRIDLLKDLEARERG